MSSVATSSMSRHFSLVVSCTMESSSTTLALFSSGGSRPMGLSQARRARLASVKGASRAFLFLLAEHQRRTHNRSNLRLIGQFADKSGEMVDWLIANGPAEVADSLFLRKAPMWQTYFDEGAGVNTFKCWLGTIQYNFNAAALALIATAEERGAKWVWETSGVVLLTEEAEVPMLVDGFGESGVFGQIVRAERLKPGRYFSIFDSNFRENISRMPPEHFSLPVLEDYDFESLFASWVERGPEGGEAPDGGAVCCWGAESLEDLLSYLPMTDEAKVELAAEIERYNGHCEAGEDDDFGRDPKTLVPVNKPPYYAIMSVDEKPMVGTVTLNGLVIDDKQHVLDKRYNPIVGLYATGNNSDGRFAVQYSTQMQGLTLGFAMTHGRELGKALARM